MRTIGTSRVSLPNGPIEGWGRDELDQVPVSADIDNDGEVEFLITKYNPPYNPTGIVKSINGKLKCIWRSDSPLTGQAGSWDRFNVAEPVNINGDVFGVTRGDSSGQAFSISRYDNEEYGILEWINGSLQLAYKWNAVKRLRKFSFLYDIVEVTGVISNFVESDKPLINAPGIDLAVDPGFSSICMNVNRSENLHCETYPEGLVPGGIDNQINYCIPFSPWPGQTYTANNGGQPLLGLDPVSGSKRQLQKGDHIRVQGRLIIENGHPQPGNPSLPPGVGTAFVELHPFDWANIVLESDERLLHGAIARNHTFLVISPLYSAIEEFPRQSQYPNQLDNNMFLNADPPVYTRGVETTAFLSGPIGDSSPVSYAENVIVNNTGKTLDEIRTVTVSAGGITVHAVVVAEFDLIVGPYYIASPDQLAQKTAPGILQIEYTVVQRLR